MAQARCSCTQCTSIRLVLGVWRKTLWRLACRRVRVCSEGLCAASSPGQEHSWTPGGACMPLKLAIAPSTVRASTRARADRPHGRAMLTSVVKRGRDLLAPSPISEGGEEETASSMAGPRRLSYSSTAPHFLRCYRIIMTSISLVARSYACGSAAWQPVCSACCSC